MSEKKIIVVPFGGLGNRMRVLSSCIEIAKRENRALWIAWPKNRSLNCKLTDIFENIGIEYHIPSRWMIFLLTNIYRHGAIRRFTKSYKFITEIIFGTSIFDFDTEFNSRPEINYDNSTILVATCFAFGSQIDYRLFRFAEFLINKTEKEYYQIDEPYIGIHIRRTDHIDLIKLTPLENYLIQIDICIKSNPTQKFLLATDDEEIKSLLKNKYRNLIYTFNHKLGRNNLDGIYGSVIELLMLSKSTKLICSSLSSYSDTAILIGGIKDVIAV